MEPACESVRSTLRRDIALVRPRLECRRSSRDCLGRRRVHRDQGTITAVTFANPHPTIEVDVKGDTWRVDLARLARLARAGFNEDSAKIGDELVALGNRSRDRNEKRLKAVRVTIAGRTYDGYPERIPVNGVAPKAQGWAGELERLGAVRAMKASFVTYPLISAIHVLSIATLVSCVILLDLRLLGRFAGLPQAELVPVLRQIVLPAFGFAIITGLLMFSVRANTYIKNEPILDKNAVGPACGIERRYIYMA